MEFVPASAVGCEKVADVFTRAFDGYFVPIRVDRLAMERMVAMDSVDLACSWVARSELGNCGLVLVARRGRHCRIASMGVVAEARGSGLGRRLLERAIADAEQRGELSIRLECIEQNMAAMALYKSAEFVTVGRLAGFEATSAELLATNPAAIETPEYQIIEPRVLAAEMKAAKAGELPWQVDADRMVNYNGVAKTIRLGDAIAQITASENSVKLGALWVRPEKRLGSQARGLVIRVAREFPDATWSIPALVPRAIAGFFTRVGFRTMKLSQVEMVRHLSASKES